MVILITEFYNKIKLGLSGFVNHIILPSKIDLPDAIASEWRTHIHTFNMCCLLLCFSQVFLSFICVFEKKFSFM